jgi:hypothetical protein
MRYLYYRYTSFLSHVYGLSIVLHPGRKNIVFLIWCMHLIGMTCTLYLTSPSASSLSMFKACHGYAVASFNIIQFPQ